MAKALRSGWAPGGGGRHQRHFGGGTAVGHHDQHGLGLSGGDQVIQNQVRATHGDPSVLGVARPVQQVQHGVAAFARFVTGRRVDPHAAGDSQRFRLVQVDVHGAVRHGLNVPYRGSVAGHFEHRFAGPVALFHHGIVGIDIADAVDREFVVVDVGLERTDGDGPIAVLAFLHILRALHEIAGQLDGGGVRRAQLKHYGAVGVHDVRRFGRSASTGATSTARRRTLRP